MSFANVDGLYAKGQTGVVQVKDHYGDILVVGDGNLDTIAEIISSDGEALVKLYDTVTVSAMDIGFYQILDEVDLLFDFINGNRLDILGDGLFASETGVDELIAMLTTLIENIAKLEFASASSLAALLASGSGLASKMSGVTDEMSKMRVKYSNLLALIEQKLARLQLLNTNMTKLEVSTIAASELTKLHGEFLRLNANVSDLGDDVNNLLASSQRGIDNACKQLADLTAIQYRLTESTLKIGGIKSTLISAAAALDVINIAQREAAKGIDEAADACAELDEYVKCLIIYASSMVEAGENMAIRKEGNVYRLDSVLPEPPPCPEIEFVEVTTTARPTTTVPPKATPAPPKGTTTAPDTTSAPPPAGCPAPTISMPNSGGNNWRFDTDGLKGKTIGNPKSPEIIYTNTAAYAVTVEIKVDVKVLNYSNWSLRIDNQHREYMSPVAGSNNTTLTVTSVEFLLPDSLNRAGANFSGTYVMDCGAGETLEFNISMTNSYPRECLAGITNLTIKTSVSDGKGEGYKARTRAKPNMGTGAPAPGKCPPSQQTKNGISELPELPWRAAEMEEFVAFYKDLHVDQDPSSIDPRPDNKAVWSTNKWTTMKGMRQRKFVFQHGVRRKDDKQSYMVFTYDNYDFDVEDGFDWTFQSHMEGIQRWLSIENGYEYFETYSWEAAARHFWSWDGGSYYMRG